MPINIEPEVGGKSAISADNYIEGAPKLDALRQGDRGALLGTLQTGLRSAEHQAWVERLG